MALLLYPDGSEVIIQPKNGHDFSLDELKSCIGGGWIELVYLDDGRIMVIDEEGKLKRQKYNINATRMLNDPLLRDYIAGIALVCNTKEIE